VHTALCHRLPRRHGFARQSSTRAHLEPPRARGQADAQVQDGKLTDISGIASSKTNPGYLWVHEDSGEPPKP
jgi:hypothetical protein